MLRVSILLTLLTLTLPAQAPAPRPPSPSPTPKPAAPAAAPSTAGVRRPAPAAKTALAPRPSMTDDQKLVYTLGLMLQRSLGQFDLSPAELDLVKRALSEGLAGKPAVDLNEWGPRVQTLARDRAARVSAREKAASAAFLAKAATAAGVVRTDSGLIYSELAAGQGASPKATDMVKVNYRGTLINGVEFDSSYKRGEPAQFSLGSVIKCWTQGLQMMKVGGKARLVCPSDLAYGDGGGQSIPGGAALIFEVELLDVVQVAPASPKAPPP